MDKRLYNLDIFKNLLIIKGYGLAYHKKVSSIFNKECIDIVDFNNNIDKYIKEYRIINKSDNTHCLASNALKKYKEFMDLDEIEFEYKLEGTNDVAYVENLTNDFIRKINSYIVKDEHIEECVSIKKINNGCVNVVLLFKISLKLIKLISLIVQKIRYKNTDDITIIYNDIHIYEKTELDLTRGYFEQLKECKISNISIKSKGNWSKAINVCTIIDILLEIIELFN